MHRRIVAAVAIPVSLLMGLLMTGCSGYNQSPSSGEAPATATRASTVSAQATAAAQCPPSPPAPAAIPGVPAAPAEAKTVTTPSGLQYIDITSGTGAAAQAGQTANVNYTGWLLNGTKFDSSLDRGQPFSFPLGGGQVIKGWDEGVVNMHVGGKRRLIVPPDLAYGNKGAGGVIPACSTLVFDVDLLGVK